MALNKQKLAKGIKKAFDEGHKIVKKNDKADMHWEIAKRIADSIDEYIRGGDVKVDTDTPNVKIMPGIATPLGSTIAPGNPVPMSTKGTGKGKVV
tara:strand:+ start:90 stop:374 length:285 start_codon:yes stop_codon:yes gene_type:complete